MVTRRGFLKRAGSALVASLAVIWAEERACGGEHVSLRERIDVSRASKGTILFQGTGDNSGPLQTVFSTTCNCGHVFRSKSPESLDRLLTTHPDHGHGPVIGTVYDWSYKPPVVAARSIYPGNSWFGKTVL